MNSRERLAVLASWVLVIVGGMLSCVILFAAGMKAAPHITAPEAFVAILLPLSAAVTAVWAVVSTHQRQVAGNALIWTALPLCLAVTNMALVLVIFATQSGF